MSLQRHLRLAGGLTLLGGAVASHAQSAPISVPVPPLGPAAPPAPLSETERWINALKNPSPWIAWGGDLRVRDEHINNAVSLTSESPIAESNVIRFRARLWTTITPVTNLTANARLAAELREWTKPAFPRQYRNESGMEWRYGILDTANVKWANILDQPLTITAGRQDLMFGEAGNGWLVFDGTPSDGSWTYFLDSARVAYDARELKTRFDAVYIDQNARADAWMPTLNAHQDNYQLTDQDEQGAILYASNRSIANTTLDGYFIYKHDEQYRSEYVPDGSGDTGDIYTFGARISGLPGYHWSYSAEGAYQFGWKDDTYNGIAGLVSRDIRAYGGNARLSYLARNPVNDQFHLIFEYLSGDDPATATDEMFDVLWGRWPRYSELYFSSYAAETNRRNGQHNNLIRLGGGWNSAPARNLTLGAYYNALFALQDIPTRATDTPASPLFSRDGTFRGHYAQAVVVYAFSRHLKAQVWGEFVWQGDYYASRDLAAYLRAEVLFTF
jgi:hypothetical protein